jgi:Amidohydrolase
MDSHIHMRDASPENWVKGQEQYAKGWIECFHAYMGLAATETHWPIEKFMKYSEEDFVKDVFEDGGVDVGVFQSTYLKEWYTDGFNTAQRNVEMAAKHPGKLIVNGRWDPREGEAGLKQLEEDAGRYTGEEINAALARGEGFTGAFPGETADDDLEALRVLFLRKALVARQGRVCEALLAGGLSHERVAALRVGDLPDGPEARRCVQLRERLGDRPRAGGAAVRVGRWRVGRCGRCRGVGFGWRGW